MKNSKGFLAAIALAVLVSALQLAGTDFSPKSLRTAVIGDYGYTSGPINYQARNFLCYPGPIQTSGTYAGTYNTYYYSYAEGYTNSGVQGNWCQAYSVKMGNPTKNANNKYIVTDANGIEDTTNIMYQRWLDHKNAAFVHDKIVVFYKNSLLNYSSYYITGNASSSTGLDPNGSGLYGNSVVHCPDGARPVDHTTTASQYRGSSSPRHYGSSPSDSNGMYDGDSHYWCERESDGVPLNPLPGFDYRGPADYIGTDKDKLFKFELPGGIKKYTSYKDSTNMSGSGFVKCPDGASAVGPFTNGNQYTNQYWVKEAGKRDYYRCYDSAKGLFLDAIADSTALPSPYSLIGGYFRIDNVKNCDATYTTCQPSCAAGDSTCGGANTIGSVTQACASNTYWCQTTSKDYRYCSADPTCTAEEMTAPAVYSATITHINYASSGDTVSAAVGGTITIVPGVKSYHPWIEIQNTGDTSDTYTFTHTNTSSDNNVSAGKIKNCVYTVNDAPVTSLTIAAGASQKVHLQCNVEDVSGAGVVLTQALIVNSQGKGQTLGTYTYNITTKKPDVCSDPDNEGPNTVHSIKGTTTGTYGPGTDSCTDQGKVREYYCDPTGQVLSTDIICTYGCSDGVCLPKSPDDPTTTCQIGETCQVGGVKTKCGASAMRCDYPTNNSFKCINAGEVCPTITPTPEITLNGTIFKDGQYVDPATSTLRNCVSPNYWMKENPTSSGARGFHCMPNTPNYTLTSDHYPPTPCTGTLWAVSGTTATTFFSDYCATSKDSSITPPPPPAYCNYDGTCNNGETSGTCPADCSYTPPSTCKLGQKDCDPNLSCDQGKRCYVGEKLSCVNWDSACTGNTCAPPGSSQYYPGCKEAGSITDRVGDDFPGYCDFSMACYSKDEKKRYCQPISTTMAAPFAQTCTNPEFPKGCSPLDTSCLDIGESATSGYCSPGGKECYTDGSTSFTCIAESDECKGSVCPTDPKDPRYKGCTAEGPGPENGWCAIRNSIQFFKQSTAGGIYCLKNPDPTDMYFWETATPPEGYGRCRYGEANNGCIDKLNVPVKKVSGKGYWCAVGMRQDDEVNGIITCVSGKDYKPPRDIEPPIKVCQDAVSVAYNPSTLDCKTFSNSCLSEGWVPLGMNQACENGKVIELSKVTDDKALIEIIDKKLSFLDSIRYRLKELPVSLSETAVLRDLVDKAAIALKALRAKLPVMTAKARGDVSEELERVNKNILADIEDKWAKVQPYVDFATLRDEIFGRLPDLKHEASACDQSTDYCKYLNDVIPTLESLLGAAEGQTGKAFEQFVTDIKNIWDKSKKIREEERTGDRDRFFETQVKKLLDDREKIRGFIKDHAIDNPKITRIFSEFDTIVTYLQNIVSTMEFEVIPIGTIDVEGMPIKSTLISPKQMLEKAFGLKARLEEYLMAYDYEVVDVKSLKELMPWLQEEMEKQLELLFPKIEQTIKILMDEALQELALNTIKIVEALKPEIKEAVSQGLSNLSIELNESRRAILDEVIAAKNEIVKSLSELEMLVTDRLGAFTANRYRTDVIEVVAPVVWCGDYAALVESRINNAGLAIESGENVNVDELHTFVTEAMADNIIECRRVGASRFYMPIESWYWLFVEESAEKGCIKGYSDFAGTAIGYFGEADPALRSEAVKMVSCIFGVAQGVATTDRSDVAAWFAPYFNGLKAVVPDFDWSLPMDKEITRFEIAELVVKTMLALDKNNIVTEADKLDLVEDFTDASQVAAHKYALAVETLVDLGVLNGHADGHFGGYESALRSEFAAILDRVNDLIVETYGIYAEGEVAIGGGPGN